MYFTVVLFPECGEDEEVEDVGTFETTTLYNAFTTSRILTKQNFNSAVYAEIYDSGGQFISWFENGVLQK